MNHHIAPPALLCNALEGAYSSKAHIRWFCKPELFLQGIRELEEKHRTDLAELFLPEEVEEEDRHHDGELEDECYEGDREVVVEIVAAAYHRSEED